MDLSNVTVDFGPIFTLATNIITALVTFIVVRKGIKLSNKS